MEKPATSHPYVRHIPVPMGRIAVVTMGVKLGSEERGYTRFRVISELLVKSGFEVVLITSSFQHWEKAQRDVDAASYKELPYQVQFIHEPGYKKNLDLARIKSHAVAAKNLRVYFDHEFAIDPEAFDLIYAEIPPNDVARVCAEEAKAHHIPFVADVNDLWPEAMRMAMDIPVLSSLAFHPFARDAHEVYRLLSAAVGTSDEYAARPAADRSLPYPHLTVYVGNDVAAFDQEARELGPTIEKPLKELWATYAGTLGASYDLRTLIRAAKRYDEERATHPALPPLRVKILGDGPDRTTLEELAAQLCAPVDFCGYIAHDRMAAYLVKSDILINSLVKSAPQSIVTKIGDYLAAAKPLINTGSSQEFRHKVESQGFGLNVEAEDPDVLYSAIRDLATHPHRRKIMGSKARAVAEREFDQQRSYRAIVDLVRSLL